MCSSNDSGNPDRRVDRRHLRAVVGFGPLNAPLDFADVVEILVEPRAIARAESALQGVGLVGDEIENASIAARAGDALGRGARFTEQPLEHRTRVDFHRQRRGRRAPRDRVGVGAAETGRAGADVAGEILGGQLERRKGVVLADFLGHDLVDRDPREDVFRFGPFGGRPREPSRGADGVIAALRGRPGEIADHDQRIAERLERLQDRRELEVGARLAGRPLLHDGAVGHVDGAKSRRRRRGCGRREGRNHRFERRQRHDGAHPAQERPTRQRHLGNEHGSPPTNHRS